MRWIVSQDKIFKNNILIIIVKAILLLLGSYLIFIGIGIHDLEIEGEPPMGILIAIVGSGFVYCTIKLRNHL